MNLFEDTGILCGNCDSKGLQRSIDRFFSLAGEIKKSLGQKGYFLDEYLRTIFESLNCLDIITTIDEADELCSNILRSCRSVLKGDNPKRQNQFYNQSGKYIQNHPFDCKHVHTKIGFYSANVLIHNIDKMCKDFISETKDKILSKDECQNISQKYKEIANIIGEHKIDTLNGLIDDVFIICPVSMIFMQLMIQRLIGMMLYKDPQTKKHIFELMINSKNNVK